MPPGNVRGLLVQPAFAASDYVGNRGPEPAVPYAMGTIAMERRIGSAGPATEDRPDLGRLRTPFRSDIQGLCAIAV